MKVVRRTLALEPDVCMHVHAHTRTRTRMRARARMYARMHTRTHTQGDGHETSGQSLMRPVAKAL